MKSPFFKYPYHESRLFEFILSGKSIVFYSKPGISLWDQISPATELVFNYIQAKPGDKIFIEGIEKCELLILLSCFYNNLEFCIKETNIISIELAKKTLSYNQITNAEIYTQVNLKQSQNGYFNKAIIHLPKGRSLWRKLLIECFYALKEGGELYLSGPNNLGARTAISDAEAIFGNSRLLGYKKGNRIASFEKTDKNLINTAWSSESGISLNSWFTFQLHWEGEYYLFHSLPGVFSYNQLDEGTRLVLQHLKVESGISVLDLGCGYGIIGIFASKFKPNKITMVDNNLLAIESTKKNVENQYIKDVNIVPSDILINITDQKFDLIITNPPFHVGMEINYHIAYEIIKQSWEALQPSGSLLLVANKFLPYKKIIEQVFSSNSIIEENSRFNLIQAKK